MRVNTWETVLFHYFQIFFQAGQSCRSIRQIHACGGGGSSSRFGETGDRLLAVKRN